MGRVLLFVGLVLVAVVVAAIAVTLILRPTPYRVPSEAMAPTLKVGERVFGTDVSSPKRGQIVVFHPPSGAVDSLSGEPSCGSSRGRGAPCARPTPGSSDAKFVQRVVALPGDRIKVVDNRAYVNGRRASESYANAGGECGELCNLPRAVKVPAGHFFVMGDNRGASLDSRAWGPVRKAAILDEVRLTFWPPGSIGSP
jgi:signal peptidase I